MRSRLAILAMLVFGFALSGTGAGLAISGVSGDSDGAATAQYDETTPDNQEAPRLDTPTQDVKGEQDESAEDTAPASGGGDDDVAGAGAGTNPVQEARQVSANAGGGELPFTGFAAIPVLMLGLALLAAGLVLRRSSRSDLA